MRLIDNFGDWSAFRSTEKPPKTCYIASAPKMKTGNVEKRGDAYVTIRHIPSEKSIDVFSVRAGYAYKKDSQVTVEIGAQKFQLFTDQDFAWTYDAKDDRALVVALKGGKEMIVRGTSVRGTLTVDTYSLTGITAAHEAIGKACEVK